MDKNAKIWQTVKFWFGLFFCAAIFMAMRACTRIYPDDMLKANVQYFHLTEVKQALDRGADPNAQITPPSGFSYPEHYTVLMVACYGPCDEMRASDDDILNLRKKGMDISAIPLSRTAQIPMIQLLLDAGADVNATDQSGHTVLYQVKHSNRLSPGQRNLIILLLEAHGAH